MRSMTAAVWKIATESPAVFLHMLVHEAEERPRCLLVHTVDSLLAIRGHGHECAELQTLQVVRDNRLLEAASLHKFRDVHGFLEEEHELNPIGVAQGLQELAMGC
jgi:hypothetical protein